MRHAATVLPRRERSNGPPAFDTLSLADLADVGGLVRAPAGAESWLPLLGWSSVSRSRRRASIRAKR